MKDGLLHGRNHKSRWELIVHKKLCIFAQFSVHGLSAPRLVRGIEDDREKTIQLRDGLGFFYFWDSLFDFSLILGYIINLDRLRSGK
jgi:hypothetical protein